MHRYPSILVFTVLAVPFSLAAGCSRTPCYKGYVAATEANALAFAQELTDRHERGDDSWFFSPTLAESRDPEFVKAVEADLFFRGKDIPKNIIRPFPDVTNEELEEEAAGHKEILDSISDIVFKRVEPKDGAYRVCFEYSREGEKFEHRITFVKHKKSGRFVILRSVECPLDPNGAWARSLLNPKGD